ncbi:uncharacterized protein LOC115951547 [Quercus lobata]|uniref:uncharacterized protein LOC115951547 n=1 Tax=Quercus lobata TaxID=97700 RepID=UPI00124849E6|nr:uncharacterized protein LOC115951547 [Quercus lobata]
MNAALNRFISRSVDRCRPFFLLLNKWKGFEWTEECALAFQQLKEYLSRPPIMSRPKVDEVQFAYIAVAPYAVLVRIDIGIQRPICYVGKSLYKTEVRYLPLEKAILAVVQATRKLPHYFRSHIVVILTQLSLRSLLWSTDYTGRIAKWGTILGAFNIKYMPCTSVKGQEPLSWKVYVDGAANQKGSRVGLVLVSPKKITIEKSLRLGFSAINNEAEYEALLVGMAVVQKMGRKAVKIFSDSRLVVGQVRGELEARNSGNTYANSLATLATSSAQGLPRVILGEDLCKPTEVEGEVVHVHQVRVGPSWMDPMVLFLKEDILPKEKSEADKVRRKAPRFWLSGDQKLYKRSFSRSYLLCIYLKTSKLLLKGLHEGICGSYTGGRSLSHKAIT